MHLHSQKSIVAVHTLEIESCVPVLACQQSTKKSCTKHDKDAQLEGPKQKILPRV